MIGVSPLREHLHHGVLGALIDRVIPEALAEVLLNHLLVGKVSGTIAHQASRFINERKAGESERDTKRTAAFSPCCAAL